MQNIYILFLFTLCFLGACAKNTIKIGTVTIKQDTNSITLIQGNRTNVIERPESSSLGYSYIITTPYIKYNGADGVPELPECKGLRDIPWYPPIRKSDFILFPLFDNKSTCLGVVKGQAGATGRSSQNLIFLDTASNRHLEFATMDMHDPVWIMGKENPVGFKTFNSLSVGPGVVSLGLDPRLEMVYSLVNGAFVPNVELRMADAKQCYGKISFTAQDKIELCKTNWMEMEREVGDKLLDAVYYGTILGKQDEVNHLLAMVTLELRKEIKRKMSYYIPTNSPDVNNPTVSQFTAFEFRGNIFIKDQDGKVTRLTSAGKNRNPLISPDEKNLVFLRKSTNTAISPHYGILDNTGEDSLADQIWNIDLKTGKEKCLVSDEDKTPREGGHTRTRAFIDRIRFSPDGSKLYFLTEASPLVDALYVVDIRTQKDMFFTYALNFDVIFSGKYNNHLIVHKHKYFLGGGAYNWYWLVNEKGQEIDAIAEEEGIGQLKEFKKIYDAKTSY